MLHPRLRATRLARAFDLLGRAAVIGCGKLVIISRGWAAVVVGKNICEICEICEKLNQLMQINNQQNLCEIELPAEVIVDEEKNNLWDRCEI